MEITSNFRARFEEGLKHAEERFRGMRARFVEGFCRPFDILGFIADDKFVLRTYLRVAIAQTVIAVGLGGLFAFMMPREPGELGFFGWFASGIFVVQTILVALTHEYHDRLTQQLSEMLGIPPEDDITAPRVWLDVPWITRKLRRYLRGFIVTTGSLAMLFPFILPVSFVFHLAPTVRFTGAVSAAYWWVVFTGAKSSRGWLTDGDRTPPVPLRGLAQTIERYRILRWWGPRLCLRIGFRTGRSMFAPARAVDADFASFMGLGVVRVIATLPVMRLLLRSAVRVAVHERLVQLERQNAAKESITVIRSIDPMNIFRG